MKLYELSEQYNQLMKLDMEPEQIADTLDMITGEIREKAEGIRGVIAHFDAGIDAIDKEIARLAAMKKAATNRVDALTDYLRVNMEATGIKKIECDLFTITLRNGSPVCVVEDESALPDDYVTVKTTVSPDKRKILAALKDGATVPGAYISTGKSSIVIK